VIDFLKMIKSEQHNVGLIMQKCRSLVSIKVSILLLWGLGLVSDVKMNVSVSWKCEKVSVSSQTEKQTSQSRLGLAPQSLVYITVPICVYFIVTCIVVFCHLTK